MIDSLIKNIIRSKRRTIALQINSDAELIVRAPFKAPVETIHKFIREKMRWILKKQKQVRENYREPVVKKFCKGEDFLYLGQSYKLSIVSDSKEPLLLNQNSFVLSEKYLHSAAKVFTCWYKWQAKQFFGNRINLHADKMGVKFASLKITSGKNRLGCCSKKGKINLSWRLMMTPVEFIDYVIIHELSHLKEHNHSKKFWSHVKLFYPDYKEAKLWLKANHHHLAAL